MNNPLLNTSELPAFSKIKIEHIQIAVETAINDCRILVKALTESETEVSWQSLVAPLEECEDRLSRIWSPVSHMNSVVNSDELRQAYEACLPILSEYGTWLGQHKVLYAAYIKLAGSSEFDTLEQSQKKSIEDTLQDFTLSGVGLADNEAKRFGEISARLSQLGSQFSNNVMDATLAWSKLVTDKLALAGLPESALAAAKQAAKDKDQEGYLFTLDFPSYLPVITYADDRQLRQEVYTAFVSRASEQGPNSGEWDNSALIDEILQLRHEQSALLEFNNYADRSLATKMADSSEQVLEFLNDLALRSKPQAEKELAELNDFAQSEYEVADLQAWDMAYYAEKLKQQRYAISDEQLRPYFPENKVIAGLFEVVSRVFGLQVKPRDGVDTWHEDVSFYDIHDQSGELRGSFYLDLYAREHKRGGAWMDDCVSRRRMTNGLLQKPVAYLTCNFNKPIGDQPALFTHDEVVTLFHEFGHGLHHMLTKIEVAAVSGINGVPWDAVELPSQFLENWCWQAEALAFISGHYQTGEPLPTELLDKLLEARNFQSAMVMVRQLELGLFDFRLHYEFDSEKPQKVQALLDEVRQQVAVLIPPAFNRFQNGFSHIFAGGYAAGYYSYKWAEVLSSDAFERFEQEGVFNSETGQDFLNHILEMGGSKEPMELFKAFRGREPKIDALLRHSGIT